MKVVRKARVERNEELAQKLDVIKNRVSQKLKIKVKTVPVKSKPKKVTEQNNNRAKVSANSVKPIKIPKIREIKGETILEHMQSNMDAWLQRQKINKIKVHQIANAIVNNKSSFRSKTNGLIKQTHMSKENS